MTSREELACLLDSCRVPWREKFGVGPYKTLDDLLAEVTKPEIRIRRRRVAGRLRIVRRVRTVRVRVTMTHPFSGKRIVLRELGRAHAYDTRTRARPFDYGASLSETVPLGSRARAWAVEAVAQELELPRLPESTFKKWRPSDRKCYESTAYPGLLSDVEYEFFTTELPKYLYRDFYFSFENNILSIFGWEELTDEDT